MNRKSKSQSRLSHSGRHPDLSQGTPISLRSVKSARLFFNDEADPLHKKQRKALQQTESERREAMSQGSLMVKRQKPFLDLKPKTAYPVLKQSFNQDWLKERQRSALRYLQQQENAKSKEQTNNSPIQSKGYEQEL